MEVSCVWKFGFASLFFLMMKTYLITELFQSVSFSYHFPSLFDLGINKALVSGFGQSISSLQSSEFSFSILCLYTIKNTKYKSRVFLTSGLKEEWEAWIMEWRRPSKERTAACREERKKLVRERVIRLVNLPVELEVSQNLGSISANFVLEKNSFTCSISMTNTCKY